MPRQSVLRRAAAAFFLCPVLAAAGAASADGTREARLYGELARLAARAEGRLGVAARIVEGGATVGIAGAERFPMQSVYKLPIAWVVLRAVDRAALRLADGVAVGPRDWVAAGQHSPLRDAHPQGGTVSIAELLELAVAQSDGSASDVLLRLAGGADRATAELRGLGIDGVTIATTEQQMAADERAQYQSWATPNGAVEMLALLQRGGGLTTGSRELLLGWLIATTTGARRLRAGLPSGVQLAHKTGSSRPVDGQTAATNDIGVATLPDGRHLAIAVFVSDSRADEATREEIIAGVARAVHAWATVGKR